MVCRPANQVVKPVLGYTFALIFSQSVIGGQTPAVHLPAVPVLPFPTVSSGQINMHDSLPF